jgi:hypothetical protein
MQNASCQYTSVWLLVYKEISEQKYYNFDINKTRHSNISGYRYSVVA